MDDRATTRREPIEESLGRLPALTAAERTAVLDELSAETPELRRQFEQLLESHDSALKFFEQCPELLPAPDSPGQMFAEGEIVAQRFRIRRLLGHGGVGEVYEAEDLTLRGERVALKTLRVSRARDESLMERLAHELQLARKINHPNVCRVYDVHQHVTASGARISLFVMELLEGETLASRLQRGPLTTRDALPIVEQIAEAVDAAHAANVAHGDLKPANIMLVPSAGGAERVVVTDFGFARWLPPGATLVSGSTETRQWGTPAYMAPEQLLGGRITRACDIYALGVVCYEMVTGARPFATEAPLLLAVRKLRQRPRPPQDVVPDLDQRWQAAILCCLDVEPDARFESAKDFVKDIQGEPRRKTFWIPAAAAFAIVFLVALGAAMLIGRRGANATTPAGGAAAEQIVAVLPFSQEKPTPEGDAFALGLTAALTDRLGSVPARQRGLHVIPVEEVVNTGVNTPALAQHTLGASLFIAGRVSVMNDRTELAIGLNEASDQGFRLKDGRRVRIEPGERGILDRVMAAATELLEIEPAASGLAAPGGAGELEAEKSYLLGRGYLARGPTDLTNAIESFQRAIQRREQFAEAHAGLSEAYRAHYVATRDTKSLRLAQDSIDRAIAIQPRDARSRVIRGRIYSMSDQYPRAILELTTALDLDPDVPDGRRWLAAAEERNGVVDKAEKTLREEVVRHSKHWSSHVHLGAFLYRRGRYREAEESFVRGLSYAPANPDAILNLSGAYLVQERFGAAETELLKATTLAPDARLYNNLGWSYILEGKFSDAVVALEAAVKLSRAGSVVWSSLARAYRWAGGRADDARVAYEMALERADEEVRLNPADAVTRGNRAYLLAEIGRTKEGLSEIEATLGQDGANRNVNVLFYSALVHEWAGERERALQDLVVAMRAGYSKGVIERHPDLARLRKDPGYRRVLEMAAKPAS